MNYLCGLWKYGWWERANLKTAHCSTQDTNAHTAARSDKKEWQMPFSHNVAQTVLELTM